MICCPNVDHCIFVGSKWSGLKISETEDLLKNVLQYDRAETHLTQHIRY